jgi:flagellar hook protein FlgE
MLSSLYSGISGLLSNSDALDVISNNISNVNTVGYKSQTAEFEDVLYQTITGASGTSQVGRGSGLESVTTDFSQGSFETTNSSTDLAIGGQGFFIVKKATDQTPYYTRVGSFSLDKNGNMIDSAGDYVQGKGIDQTTGTAFGVDGNIVISQQPSNPKPSASIDMVVNLDASSAWVGSYTSSNSGVTNAGAATGDYPTSGVYTLTVGATVTASTYAATLTLPTGEVLNLTVPSGGGNVADVTGTDATSGDTVDTGLNLTLGTTITTGTQTNITMTGFNPSSPSTSSNYQSSITVYDSLGTGHVVTAYFHKDAYDSTSQTSTWSWSLIPQSSADTVTSGGSGTLTFNSNGVLTSGGNAQATTFNFAGAQAGQTIDLVMGSTSGEGSTTQYSSASNTVYQSQDGYAPGVLQSISVSQNGVISGTYDNGQILKLYQLDIANFSDPQGLERDGGNLYSETLVSGVAYTSAPGSGGMGQINSNSLEESNVDLATQFSEMIVAQSGYEANSKVITTTDEILQSLINMKTT